MRIQLKTLLLLVSPLVLLFAAAYVQWGTFGLPALPHHLPLGSETAEPLGDLHGAPLRLRVENQLGFKMVKWIQAIEFVESIESINLIKSDKTDHLAMHKGSALNKVTKG